MTSINQPLSRHSLFAGLGLIVSSATLSGCGASGDTGSSKEKSSSAEKPEVSQISWGRANSGNIFVTLAQDKGYFEEYGLEVTESPVANDTDAMAALTSGKVDVTSNQGTVGPLQHIAAGEDLTIVGGYMLQGMYLIAKKGTKWNGIDDLVGKRIAHKVPQIPICYAMLEAGHDPMKDITWVTTDTSADRLAAVVAGEADYGYMSGDMLYAISQNDDVDIVVYADELMPAYGCCRMNMRTDFVKDNPITVKLLLKALLRAEAYFQANKDESVSILAKQLNTSEDYVAAYLKNDHYKISIDPVHNQVLKTWDVMKQIDFVSGDAKNIDIEKHIDISFYKKALAEVIDEHGDEYPDWWKNRQEFFDQYNA